jgi:serine/threonine-protein kinase
MGSSTEPAQLGRYVIQSELGRGAMGVVYKATDSVLERAVAVKTVNITLEREYADKYEQRFYQEAKAAGSLNHPNIVTIHDVGKSGDVVFMETHEKFFVMPSRELQQAVDDLFGEDTYYARADMSLPERAPRRWERKPEMAGAEG